MSLTPSTDAVNILCMKWGTKYDAVYVNRLYSMVSRHLSLPFRFICLTDDTTDIDEHVECFDIPEVDVNIEDCDGRKRVQAWKKLLTFSSPLYDIEGTCLFLDLDIVIIDSIDCFFEPEGDFHIIRDWGDGRTNGNSSVYRFTAGAMADVLSHFCDHREQVVEKYFNEQTYLTEFVRQQEKLSFWPQDWCLSYRRDCLPKNRLMRWFVPSRKPSKGRIIVFYGAPSPVEAIAGKGDRWYRQLRPAAWITDYWH
ncbi:glycosyltransferase [bacterium SCSIO 12696]|nr:glycosyltransferase [bacterium SCSIO 12696]